VRRIERRRGRRSSTYTQLMRLWKFLERMAPMEAASKWHYQRRGVWVPSPHGSTCTNNRPIQDDSEELATVDLALQNLSGRVGHRGQLRRRSRQHLHSPSALPTVSPMPDQALPSWWGSSSQGGQRCPPSPSPLPPTPSLRTGGGPRA
jgi:hypothetical protein